MSNVVFIHDISRDLAQAIAEISPDKTFILTDTHTSEYCIAPISDVIHSFHPTQIQIPSGDVNKNIDSLTTIWESLSQGGATRHSLLINLGGGMITDIGGFAAATFKRGISFINIPTSLLAMVDASSGGKTGINFNGLKNEIGAFRDANRVIIDAHFLSTLDRDNVLSGYAEMLKHALLSNDEMWATHLKFDIRCRDTASWLDLVNQSVAVKQHITDVDPFEKSIRKALNLGHTIGHAIESLTIKHDCPILHGHAVALGLIGELFLSRLLCGFPADKFIQTVQFIRENYPTPHITCDDYEELFRLMQHDKKNLSDKINFTLLSDIGQIRLDIYPERHNIVDAFDYIIQA